MALNVWVILPTYNESENISELVEQILALPVQARVIVVDDASPDGTGQLADELARKTSRVAVIHRPGKLGLGTAYIAGFKYGLAQGADRLITMDADFSHQPHYIPALVDLSEYYHITIGSRYIPKGGVKNWGWHRRFMSWAANHIARLVLGMRVHDCTAGFRCYHREVLQHVNLDEIFSDGYSFLVEMLFKCQRMGFTVGEIPIIFANRERGASKISQREIFKAMYTVSRLAVSRLKPRPQTRVSVLPTAPTQHDDSGFANEVTSS
jgi:glycosyltransferase involved in cell wall biosynthesis